MHDDILEIKLVPAWDSPSIESELKAALSQCELLQASVAFWAVKDKLFGTSLTKTLAHKDGFLCADLSLPTAVDGLGSLAQKGAHVYL